MTSSELKQAHRNAKQAQADNGGDYVVYLAFYMKKENRVEAIEIKEFVGQYDNKYREVEIEMNVYCLDITEETDEDKEEFFFVYGTTEKTINIYNLLVA